MAVVGILLHEFEINAGSRQFLADAFRIFRIAADESHAHAGSDARIHLLFDVVHIEPAIVDQQHFRFLAGTDIGPFRFFTFDEAFRETDDFIRRTVTGQQTVRTERTFGKNGPEIIKGKTSVQDILIQVAAQDEACARVGMLQHLQLER